MSDNVLITLIVCVTIIISIGMVRGTIHKLACAKKEDFTFALKLPLSTGMWLFRGNHKPPDEILPAKAIDRPVSPKERPIKK